MEANLNKLALGKTLEGTDGAHTSSICHNYGIVAGCDMFCPALITGKCEQPQDALAVCDASRDEKQEVLDLYT